MDLSRDHGVGHQSLILVVANRTYPASGGTRLPDSLEGVQDRQRLRSGFTVLPRPSALAISCVVPGAGPSYGAPVPGIHPEPHLDRVGGLLGDVPYVRVFAPADTLEPCQQAQSP